jgi:hypothetical protein
MRNSIEWLEQTHMKHVVDTSTRRQSHLVGDITYTFHHLIGLEEVRPQLPPAVDLKRGYRPV